MVGDAGSEKMVCGEPAHEVQPLYEADDEPLTRAQMSQVLERVPQKAMLSVRSSVFDVKASH